MKKRIKGRTLSRTSAQRKALLHTLAHSLFQKGKIKTTEAKAKELVPFAERCITRAKVKQVASRRYLARYFTAATVKKLVDEIAPRYKERAGGYTRKIRAGKRPSDGASMMIVELIS